VEAHGALDQQVQRLERALLVVHNEMLQRKVSQKHTDAELVGHVSCADDVMFGHRTVEEEAAVFEQA